MQEVLPFSALAWLVVYEWYVGGLSRLGAWNEAHNLVVNEWHGGGLCHLGTCNKAHSL